MFQNFLGGLAPRPPRFAMITFALNYHVHSNVTGPPFLNPGSAPVILRVTFSIYVRTQ